MDKELVLMNKSGTYAEILTDYDPDTFKYEYEKNNERSITLTAYKASGHGDIFDMLTNENYLLYDGQYFVIKSSSIKYDTQIVTNEIIAKHIFMEFQNHYVDKDIENEELNTNTTDEANAPNYTIEQYLDFAFKNNNLGFTYEIVGDTSKRAPVSELGGQNGLEYIVAGAEYFNYIYFADNKKIYFYQPETFYQRADTPIIYRGNSDELQADIVTTDMKTVVRGYGKKKTKSETKNYTPVKPKDLKYSGKFDKSGTWSTEAVGASYTKTFECKWGNETLTYTLKKGSKGGMVDIYLDNKKIDTLNQYKKTAKTDSIVIAKNLEKGEHTFKAVFKGASSNGNYKKKTPVMYVGTDKTTILNLTAVLKGEDVYYVKDEYKSPNYNAFGEMRAPTVFDDNATTQAQLRETLKEQLTDEPTVELTTNYLGSSDDRNYITGDDIQENSLVRFIHKPLDFNTDLKIVKLTKYHPKSQKPNEVEFSNAKQDIVAIQTQVNLRIKRANSAIASGNWDVNKNVQLDFYSDVMGSVLVDD
jgi:hypothetical protein